jgi:hypothetical protein
MPITDNSATEHLRDLAAGATTAVALTQVYLDRIASIDNRIGAFLRVDVILHSGYSCPGKMFPYIVFRCSQPGRRKGIQVI